MKFVIELLEENKKHIERNIRNNNMMHNDMRKATAQLAQVNQLKRAIKILKLKNNKR